ncbi:uncharacterized protein LOC106867964 [Octopus bimaculoides]|uniref:Cell death regulator Aven n=1 Tax=Octopus bimaculoides TaxID=37653 RepID=A0A0L8HXR2_OCTBM|nr:uncharacterized protein LOC106867964 [Octopus bimaculoides]|eukprot:XP_014768532.1 PREDICTED: uncharacterized protein LOC106867964 [Octopus bimaculoides]
MRPDQHKQKKSQQYKKKHGIPTKGKEHKENKGQEHGTKKTESHLNHQKEDFTNVSDSEEFDSVSKPLFRRRKLASNWDRYAPLPPEDEDDVKPQQIGVDFVSLLSQTADSLSQFRFKDEKEWEDEKSINSSFVALNCEKLAESLQCIPLHERLALPVSLFSPDQIDAFRTAAAAEEAKYVPDSGSTILQESLPVFSHKTIETILSTGFQVPETDEKWHVDLKPCTETTVETDLNENQDKSANIAEPKQTSNENDCKTSHIVLTQCETEVDALLSMGSSKTDVNMGNQQLMQNDTSCKQSKDEELAQINGPEALPKKTEKQYVSAATSSLEDWLDSVLDD